MSTENAAAANRRVVVVWPSESFPVAGVAAPERLLIGLYRAGFDPIIVTPQPVVLPRATRLGVTWTWTPTVPNEEGAPPQTWIDGALWLNPADLTSVQQPGDHLVDHEGHPLGVRMPGNGPHRRAVLSRGGTLPVRNRSEARLATGQFWRDLPASAEGVIERLIHRPMGRALARGLVHTPITPNAVTTLAAGLGLTAAGLIAQGSPVAGSCVLLLSLSVDCADGDLARATFQTSEFGRWYDLIADQVVHLALFFGIGWHVARAHPGAPALALAASAMLGAALSFWVVLGRQARGPLPVQSAASRLLAGMVSRDFAWVILLGSIVGRLDLFLWAAAVGSHAFWLSLAILTHRTTQT